MTKTKQNNNLDNNQADQTSNQMKHWFEIAVPVPLRHAFTYHYHGAINPGCRVIVSFGRRKLLGIVVVELDQGTNLPNSKIKPVIEVLDKTPSISPTLCNLMRWAAGYYHHPIGETLLSALPGKLRRPQHFTPSVNTTTHYRATNQQPEADIATLLQRAIKQKQIYAIIAQTPQGLSFDQIKAQHPNVTRQQLDALRQKQLITTIESAQTITIQSAKHPLTQMQHRIVEQLLTAPQQFCTHLLEGVTGSGKTEVYLAICEATIRAQRQALILIPEISLSPQLIARFKDRFGDAVFVSHSQMTEHQRFLTWQRSQSLEPMVVLGTRSAIFTPMNNLGLIVIDEEHDISYKQQDGFRYHARDIAIKRASIENINIVLGSATPSFESRMNANLGRYHHHRLTERIGTATLPTVNTIDTKQFAVEQGLSQPLLQALKQRLEQKQQSILFINRRGFAPVVMCYDCGWRAQCKHCDSYLTYHQPQHQLRCHHCGHREPAHKDCPDCQSTLQLVGIGTQRLEQALQERLPKARILRLDRDQITTTKQLETALAAIHNQDIDIIIGTQLIVKGHDFGNVTLVGVIQSDSGFYSIDFRALEYWFQQLVQVSGRAGRAHMPGQVLIQTAYPEHQVFDFLKTHDYDAFSDYSLEQRQLLTLPPYAHTALWRAESIEAQSAIQFLKRIKSDCHRFNQHHGSNNIEIFDVVEAPHKKRSGYYRAQLLVISKKRGIRHSLVEFCLDNLSKRKTSAKIRWSIDIDPMDMY